MEVSWARGGSSRVTSPNKQGCTEPTGLSQPTRSDCASKGQEKTGRLLTPGVARKKEVQTGTPTRTHQAGFQGGHAPTLQTTEGQLAPGVTTRLLPTNAWHPRGDLQLVVEGWALMLRALWKSTNLFPEGESCRFKSDLSEQSKWQRHTSVSSLVMWNHLCWSTELRGKASSPPWSTKTESGCPRSKPCLLWPSSTGCFQ